MGVLKTLSSQAVLRRASSGFNITNSGWHGEALEWIGDAIRLIGYHTGFEKKDFELIVENYRVKVPSVIETIEDIEFNNLPVLLGYDNDNLIRVKGDGRVASYEEILDINKEYNRFEELKSEMIEDPSSASFEALDDSYKKINKYVSNIGLGNNKDIYKGYKYNVESGYLKFNFPTGKISVKANTYMVDEDDYPMIVDTGKYTSAVNWYIIYQLLLGGYQHPVITWQEAYQMWENYRQQAANEPKIMSKDQWERFSLRWNSLGRNIALRYTV